MNGLPNDLLHPLPPASKWWRFWETVSRVEEEQDA